MYLSLSDLGLSDDCPPGLVPQPGPLGHFACVPASLASQPYQAAGATQALPPVAAGGGASAAAPAAPPFVVAGTEVPGWVVAGGALAAGYAAWYTWFRKKPKRKKPTAA